MTTALYTHPSSLEHEPDRRHPESPKRIGAVEAALSAFAALDRRAAPEATREQLLLVHSAAHVDGVLGQVPDRGTVWLDPDTGLSPGSGQAALHAAGAVVAAVDAVMAGTVDNAFCALRPPGHHAEPGRAMGFCLFNSVAIGAFHARAAHGLNRIAVVDFDVHHGNGTQAAFWNEPDFFYASTHQSPLYPGTGRPEERGVADNILNVTLSPLSGSEAFRAAYEGTVLPALRRFAPEFLLISAGFDGHRDDPLANLRLRTEDFQWVTQALREAADATAGGRVVSTLEGGYNLDALGDSAAAHVRGLMHD